MSKLILCDVDGTVADNSHRQHFLEGKKDWEGFFSTLLQDEPIFPIINKVIQDHKNGKKIVFLTGRPERYRDKTTEWLQRFFEFKFELIMRKDNDQRHKLIVKEELFNSYVKEKSVHIVYENDLELIKMWKSMGLKVLDVNLGDE